MARKLLVVEDNTAPAIVLTLQRSGSAINVTGGTVDLYISLGGTITNTGHTACSLTSPASGIVTYQPVTGDFATPGTYNCEAKITYVDSRIETVYEKFTVNARARISS
jgi:hypothetical protein